MRKALKVLVKETSYALVLDTGDDGVETLPTSSCVRRLCVRTITKEVTLEGDRLSEAEE